MDLDLTIENQPDRTIVRLNEVGESWGCGSYLTHHKEKAHREHPLRLLFFILWCAAELDAISHERDRQSAA